MELPPNLSIVEADILTIKCDYIMHQCHCVDKRSGGLAGQIFSVYPGADVFHHRQKAKKQGLSLNPIEPGSITIGPTSPVILNVHAQLHRGGPSNKEYGGLCDTKETRESLFRDALNNGLAPYDLQYSIIAVPWRIGCGIGGGSWQSYFWMVVDFARHHQDIRVVLCRLASFQQEEIPPKPDWFEDTVKPLQRPEQEAPQGSASLQHAAQPNRCVATSAASSAERKCFDDESSSAPSTTFPFEAQSAAPDEVSDSEASPGAGENDGMLKARVAQLEDQVRLLQNYYEQKISRLVEVHKEQLARQVQEMTKRFEATQSLSKQELENLRADAEETRKRLAREERQRLEAEEAKRRVEKELEKGREEMQKKLAVARQRAAFAETSVPKYWRTDFQKIPYNKRVDLLTKTEEYQTIAEFFYSLPPVKNLRARQVPSRDKQIAAKTQFEVVSIERIHNQELYRNYCFEKAKLRRFYGDLDHKGLSSADLYGTVGMSQEQLQTRHRPLKGCKTWQYLQGAPMKTPCLDEDLNEYWMFHGSDWQTINFFLTESQGYDPRVASPGRLGRGFYLTDDPRKSDIYIYGKERKNGDNDQQYGMLLYRVLIGNSQVLSQSQLKDKDNLKKMTRPDFDMERFVPYDSVLAESADNIPDSPFLFRELVLYEKYRAYPEYLVTYKRYDAGGDSQASGSRWNTWMSKAKQFLSKPFQSKNEEFG